MPRNIFFTVALVVFMLPNVLFSDTYSIAAVVGGKVITLSELDHLTKSIAMLDSSAAENEATLRQQVLGLLIKTRLQLNVADKMGVKLSGDERKSLFNSQKALIDKLSSKKVLQDVYRNFLVDQFTASKVLQLVMRERIQIDEVRGSEKRAELLTESRQYYLKDIVLQSEDSALQPEDEKHLESLKKTWQKKKLLPTALPKGFEMQVYKWALIDELPDVFKSAILSMKRMDVSMPIKTENGWHLIKLVGMRNRENFDDSDASIRQKLFVELAQDVQKQWLESLEQQQYVEIKIFD